jgi:hypothetical protein
MSAVRISRGTGTYRLGRIHLCHMIEAMETHSPFQLERVLELGSESDDLSRRKTGAIILAMESLVRARERR